MEQLCGFYDHDASSSSDNFDNEEVLPPHNVSSSYKLSSSMAIETEDPTSSQATNSESELGADEVSEQLPKPDQNVSTSSYHQPRSDSPRNKRQKVKKPMTKTSTALGDKSENSSNSNDLGVKATTGKELAVKRSISAKKPLRSK